MKFCIVRQIGPLDRMRRTERFGRRSSVAGHQHDAEDDGRRQPGRDADQPDAEHDGGGDAAGVGAGAATRAERRRRSG